MLWVPKSEWFFFLLDRARALREMQKNIFRRQPRPQNYITLCGIISYLLQALTSTPVKVPTFVNDALYTLQYGAVIGEFGMFFLHNMSLEHERVIPFIRQYDTHVAIFQAGYKVLPTRVS